MRGLKETQQVINVPISIQNIFSKTHIYIGDVHILKYMIVIIWVNFFCFLDAFGNMYEFVYIADMARETKNPTSTLSLRLNL